MYPAYPDSRQGKPPLAAVFFAGGCAGAASALIASPTELIKVRRARPVNRWLICLGTNAIGDRSRRTLPPHESVGESVGAQGVAHAGNATHDITRFRVHGYLFCYYF
jgi:hypothetical protein